VPQSIEGLQSFGVRDAEVERLSVQHSRESVARGVRAASIITADSKRVIWPDRQA
jgi:hypothetical protein